MVSATFQRHFENKLRLENCPSFSFSGLQHIKRTEVTVFQYPSNYVKFLKIINILLHLTAFSKIYRIKLTSFWK